jgi:glyoxylase-like metal-dependent hydrolase (beta-lactamase superfamily II)
MHQRVAEGVYLVGGGGMSDPRDCLAYALDLGETVLIDCGCGPGWPAIKANMVSAGLDPAKLHTLVLTHCHVDHIGAARDAKRLSRCRIAAHELDADAIETGDSRKTAANWYDMDLPEVEVDHRVKGGGETLEFAGGSLRLIHTPGHTPGSMAALLETGGQKVLFGQDIHGPFDPAFGSDTDKWRESMELLLSLEADVLCEGHFGVYKSNAAVRRFIEKHLGMY